MDKAFDTILPVLTNLESGGLVKGEKVGFYDLLFLKEMPERLARVFTKEQQ